MADLKLFEKYVPLVYHIIKKFKITEEHKDDIAQECLLRLWKCCNNYNEELNTQFITYAYICIQNTICTYLRKSKKHFHLELRDISSKDKSYMNIEIVDLFNSLSEEDSNIFKKHFVDKYTNKEIAENLGLSNQVISNKLKRIKEKLSKHYENQNFSVRAHVAS